MANTVATVGTFTLNDADRRLVRATNGDLYLAVADRLVNGSIEVYKSSDNGTTWAEQDTSNKPTGSFGVDGYCCASACIDKNDLMRIVYWNKKIVGKQQLRYVEFDTTTDSFQNDSLAQNGQSTTNHPTFPFTSCAIANDRLHVAYIDVFVTRGSAKPSIFYTNYNGTSWTSAIKVGIDKDLGCIMIEGESAKKPVIAGINIGGLFSSVFAWEGNQENATSFSSSPVLANSKGISYNARPNISQSHDGTISICYVEVTTNDLKVIRHNSGDSWTTWQTAVTLDNSDNYIQAQMATRGYGKMIKDEYVLSVESGASDLQLHDNYNTFQNNTWRKREIETGTIGDVSVKWSNYHNKGFGRVDYVFIEGGNIYHNFIDLNNPII